ncbi:hypothetical protein [Devosia sp. Root105]|uniref:hypothetical protein n=1 Tax=Devosia sp. Root105 TaxID=1736423 RepID=UPI0006F72710|nr:hypothetical protein [Devosia sp. Root105]KQU96460.1 hypothetical protein ASC68_13865 [Devosia sp. Root105]
MADLQIQSRADHDRLRQRAAQKHKTNEAIAETTVRVVAEFLRGRPASACMTDLVQKAKEFGR